MARDTREEEKIMFTITTKRGMRGKFVVDRQKEIVIVSVFSMEGDEFIHKRLCAALLYSFGPSYSSFCFLRGRTFVRL
jgi:hypothetical protein